MRVYPQEFRSKFGESVDQAFRDLARDAFRAQGYLGIVVLWFRVLPDLIFSAIELLSSKAGDYLKWSFRLQWVIACSVGWTLGRVLAQIAVPVGFPPDLAGIPIWLCLGALQSHVLTNKYCDRARWVFYSVTGSVLGYALRIAVFSHPAFAVVAQTLPIWALRIVNVPVVLTGAVIGLFQWWTIRKGHLNASRWIMACAAGLYTFWLLEYPIWSFFNFASWATGIWDTRGLVIAVFTSLIAGAAFGAITAAPLERILRPQSVAPEA
jgi:hypothetical protein